MPLDKNCYHGTKLKEGEEKRNCVKNVSHRTPKGTAFSIALMKAHREIVSVLLDNGAYEEELVGDVTPLCLAIKRGWDDVAHKMITAGADIQLTSPMLEEILNDAIRDSNCTIVQLCLECNAPVNKVNMNTIIPRIFDTLTPLHRIAELLIGDERTSLDAVEDGLTPLSHSLIRGLEQLAIKLVTTNRVNVNHINPGSRGSQLILAIKNGLYDAARVLLENNADTKATNTLGETPLIAAVKICHPSTVELLVKSGVEILVKDNAGKSALDYANKCSNADEIKAILDSPYTATYNEATKKPSV